VENLIIFALDQVREVDMVKACSTYGKDEKFIENLKGRDHLGA
jgi:hypothetical protein